MRWEHLDREEFRILAKTNTVEQLANYYRVSPRTIQRWKRDTGISQPRNYRCKMPAGWDDKARRLLDDGASVYEVMRTIGGTPATIRRHFPGAGWTREEASRYGQAVRRANEQMRRLGLMR